MEELTAIANTLAISKLACVLSFPIFIGLQRRLTHTDTYVQPAGRSILRSYVLVISTRTYTHMNTCEKKLST